MKWILLGAAALLALWFFGIYNRFVRLRNLAQEAWSGVDVQLKRRWDLVPNLVETVKGYAAHEKQIFEDVAKFRNAAIGAGNPRDAAAAEMGLSGGLKNLFAVAEAYPDLKANTNFQQLQAELSDIENKLAAARRFFNNAVSEFNAAIQAFPAVFFAPQMGFSPREFFDVGEETRKQIEVAPTVKF